VGPSTQRKTTEGCFEDTTELRASRERCQQEAFKVGIDDQREALDRKIDPRFWAIMKQRGDNRPGSNAVQWRYKCFGAAADSLKEIFRIPCPTD
jgi:hypothetical protein